MEPGERERPGPEMATTCIPKKEGSGLQSKDQPLQNALRFFNDATWDCLFNLKNILQKKTMHFVGTYFMDGRQQRCANCSKQPGYC